MVSIPAGQAPSTTYVDVPNTTTNLFCAGHAFLPDGRLLVAGGHEGRDHVGSKDTNILEYGSQYTWRLQASNPMLSGRWYPTMALLGNGEVLVLSGSVDETDRSNELPEVWQTNAGGGWRSLTSANLALPLYPMAFLAPNGKVFVAGPHPLTRYLDTEANSRTGAWTTVGNRTYGSRDYGSAVVYDAGKVLVAGGGNPPTNTAEIIDLNVSSPVWRTTGSMRYARRQHNVTVLPDGKVLATGGTSSSGFNDGTLAVMAAEMWDPSTGAWTTLASMQVKRLYHSTALLLPDGRVLSAGGGRPAGTAATDNENCEIYSPPYLFNGPRPAISSAPSSISYGGAPFTVSMPDTTSIAQVTLVGLGSVSHTVNMNQRFSRLSFSQASGSRNLSVTPPALSMRNICPPGHYMLFILNGAGVPSIAKIVRLG